MRINVIALSVTAGLFWGAAMLIVASANAIWPSYGGAFLGLAAPIYSGYDPGPGMRPINIVTLCGLVDGAIAGAVFGWLYSFLSRKFPSAAA
jgi:hypothetical protein